MFRSLIFVAVVLLCSLLALGQTTDQSQNLTQPEIKRVDFSKINLVSRSDFSNWQPPVSLNPFNRGLQMNVQAPPRAFSRVRHYGFITLISEPKPWRPGQDPYKVKYGNTKVCLVNWCPKFSFWKNQPNMQIAVKGNF